MSAQRAYSRAAESIALDSRDAYLSTSPVKSKRRKGKTLRKALRLAADSIAVSSRTVRAHSMSSIPKSRSFSRGYPNPPPNLPFVD